MSIRTISVIKVISLPCCLCINAYFLFWLWRVPVTKHKRWRMRMDSWGLRSINHTVKNIFLMWVWFPLCLLVQNWRDLWQSRKSEPCVNRLYRPSSTSTRTTSFTETWKRATSCSHWRATSSWVRGKALRHSKHVSCVSRQEKTSGSRSNDGRGTAVEHLSFLFVGGSRLLLRSWRRLVFVICFFMFWK